MFSLVYSKKKIINYILQKIGKPVIDKNAGKDSIHSVM